MGLFRKLGRGALKAADAAERLNDGMDEVLGEDRTQPGDSFSIDRARQRSEAFTQKKRNDNSSLLGSEGSDDREFFGKSDEEDDEGTRFF